ncbi:hypothetical protein Pmani_036762 [Petrolisthes manimaculis]|uniref:Uncharacterized protein n=1 Tax=Petrolisthes manimaculis TaxID=1843537 RepID=A0AAE1NJ45_9EUCA|nr:hypothetical protein Pmani_036762 [Petrolisthes manimaculis]
MDSPPLTEERAFRRFSELSTREGDFEASNSDESRAFVSIERRGPLCVAVLPPEAGVQQHLQEKVFVCLNPYTPPPSPPPSTLPSHTYPSLPPLSPSPQQTLPVSVSETGGSYLGSCVYPPGSSVGYPPDPRTALSYLLVRPEAKYLPAPALLPSLTPTLTSASPPSVVQ